MTEPTVKSKKGKQINRQPKVVCNWSYGKETTPGFRRLMSRLLKNRKGMSDEDR